MPTLLVIDYAESRRDQLARLLRTIWESTDSPPIRLLLLARSPGTWWHQLQVEHPDILTGSLVTPLTTLDPAAEKRENTYSIALTSFARRLPEIDSGKDWEAISQEIGPPEDLNSSEFGSPLTLQLSALNALLEAGEFRSSMDDDTPEGRLLKHEQHYWQRTAADMGITLAPATLSYAVAASTLMGAADEAEALATLGRIPTLADQKADVRLAVALWLRDLYPTVDGKYWGALQPDLIGEHHIGTISESNPDLVGHLLDGSSQGQAYRALTVLARATAHQAHLRSLLPRLLLERRGQLEPVAVTIAIDAKSPWVAAPSDVTAVYEALEDEEKLFIWSQWLNAPRRLL
ncbi:hypothetical protein HerbRD11066_42690 [Herbidospora sp. RD11066]